MGFLIDYPFDLLKISNNPVVFISRKALKHFVESRSKELRDKYPDEEVFVMLFFAIENLEKVIQKYDSLALEEDDRKEIYTKHFGIGFKSSVRIVIEYIKAQRQVKSIHFQRYKKATD